MCSVHIDEWGRIKIKQNIYLGNSAFCSFCKFWYFYANKINSPLFIACCFHFRGKVNLLETGLWDWVALFRVGGVYQSDGQVILFKDWLAERDSEC